MCPNDLVLRSTTGERSDYIYMKKGIKEYMKTSILAMIMPWLITFVFVLQEVP